MTSAATLAGSEDKMRRALSILTATFMLMPCVSVAQDGRRGLPGPAEEAFPDVPSSKPPSHFRQIYICEQGKPASAKALGEITGWKLITVVGPSGKGAALVRENLPDETFLAGVFRGTRLELQPDVPCSAAGVAILAPPNRVEFIRINETRDPSAIARVANYLDARNKKGLPSEDADERPGVYLTNYHIADAKVFPLAPRYSVVLANVTYDAYALVPEKPTSLVGVQVLGSKYEKQDYPSEPNPMLFVVGDKVTELTKEFREGSPICDTLVSTFMISKRMHIHTSANGCANGIKGHMVFDLSGPTPRAVFSDWDLSD